MSVLILALVVLIACLLLGLPITFAFFGSTLSIIILKGYDILFLVPYAYKQVNTLVLLAIPLFILAGRLMEIGGIGRALVDFVAFFVGKVKGGLGAVMCVSCAAFGAISGSGLATVSCIGSILLPRMYELGYPRGHSAALLASSGVLGLFIPPSVNMILISFLAQAPMLSCFMSTVVPGLILMTLLSVVNCYLLRNNTELKTVYEMPKTFSKKFQLFGKTSYRAIPAIICPVVILGGIYSGYFTPTEAAAVAVLYAIPVGIFVYKGLDMKELVRGLVEAATTAGVIFIMLFTVIMLSRIFIMENVPDLFMGMLGSVSENKNVSLMFINIFILIVGMLMDDGSAILLLTPILMPIFRSLGLTMVQSAAILAVNTGMGTVTPPCAPFLFFAARVGNAEVGEMLKPTLIYLLCCWLPTLLLTTYCPAISTWLPGIMGLTIS